MKPTLNLRSALSAWIALGILLVPVYLWSSGGIQLSHAILFVGGGAVILLRGLRVDRAARVLGVLVVYVAIRDSFFAIKHTSIESVTPIFYMIFAWWIYVSFSTWFSDRRNWPSASRGLLLAAGVAVSGVLLMGYGATIDSVGGRSVGTFNNPNQLGYFAVCLLSATALFYLRGMVGLIFHVGLVACACFLAAASLSKAAMVATAFGALFIGFFISRSRARFVLGLLVAVTSVSIAIWLVGSGGLDDYKFVARLSDIGAQRDDSLGGRGYGILMDMGALELLFGYGAQEVGVLVGHELHSTVASFFANYGVIGGMLFIAFLSLWAKRILLEHGLAGVMVIVAPPMLYGLTHNGSRFTIFWLLLALSMTPVSNTSRVTQADKWTARPRDPRVAGA